MKTINLQNLQIEHSSHSPELQKKVIIKKGEVPNLINFSQSIITKNQQVETHRHLDMTEIFFVQSGQGQMIINNQLITLSAGMTVVVQPGEDHSVNNNNDENLTMLIFSIASE